MLRANPAKSPAPRGADDTQAHPGRPMSEAEFVAWAGEKTRAEWVDGEVILMPPVSGDQSDACVWLIQVMGLFVKANDLGVLRGPEFMVRLGRQRRRRVPDLLFLANHRLALLRPHHVEGAPDLAVEVVSPDSVERDWRDKYLEYERAGVREYWVVDRLASRLEAYRLEGKKFRRIEAREGRLASSVLPGFYLRPEWLTGPDLAGTFAVLQELGLVGGKPAAKGDSKPPRKPRPPRQRRPPRREA